MPRGVSRRTTEEDLKPARVYSSVILKSQGLLVVVQATQRVVVGDSECREMKGGFHLVHWASDGVLLLMKIWGSSVGPNSSSRVLAIDPKVHEVLSPVFVWFCCFFHQVCLFYSYFYFLLYFTDMIRVCPVFRHVYI